ncbi:MAG: hypothetical protein DMF60_11375 [Acidobacteria bacterium]|nr:MAG: hypothetical protein DMF60_11375 [Acidobacteriota bacterium]
MPEAVMTRRKRDRAIRDAMQFNEQVQELGHSVAQFRESASDDQKEIVAGLSHVAESLNYELRERVMDLVRKNLGPQEQENLMLVLRKAGEWLDAERKELQRPPKQLSELRKTTRETARKLRDLDYFETFLRSLARDVLRAMANFNFEKSRAHVSGPPLATLMTTKP